MLCVCVCVAGGEEVGVEISISPPVHHRSIIIPPIIYVGQADGKCRLFQYASGERHGLGRLVGFQPAGASVGKLLQRRTDAPAGESSRRFSHIHSRVVVTAAQLELV